MISYVELVIENAIIWLKYLRISSTMGGRNELDLILENRGIADSNKPNITEIICERFGASHMFNMCHNGFLHNIKNKGGGSQASIF